MLQEPTATAADGEIRFRLADPDARYCRVRLDADLGTTPAPRDLTWTGGAWELTIPRPPLGRVEYRFEVAVLDPENPHTVAGAAGARSVIELPGYRPPRWLGERPVAATSSAVVFPATPVGDVDGACWVPDGLAPDDPAPLLVAHDGPDYAGSGGLTAFVGALVAGGVLPPSRVLLLRAADRQAWYAANDRYADALAGHVLPAARTRWHTTLTVAAGVSLGALAALHAAWRHPGALDGLFLQSGSFFTPATDPQEAGFAGFGAVTSFVAEVLAATTAQPGTVVGLTCGATEENAGNNRLMAATLDRLGWATGYAETTGLHDFTSWRDALDPHLTRVLTTAVGRSGEP